MKIEEIFTKLNDLQIDKLYSCTEEYRTYKRAILMILTAILTPYLCINLYIEDVDKYIKSILIIVILVVLIIR